MKKKYRLPVFLFFTLLIFAGWGKKTVELLNSKKLIDLNAAIEICLSGGDLLEQENIGNPQISATPVQTPVPTEAPAKEPNNTPMPTATTKPKPRAVVINVHGSEVTCGSTQWEDMDALKERIAREANSHVTFRLVDDFAEAHVYRQIIAILEELEAELGLSYIRD